MMFEVVMMCLFGALAFAVGVVILRSNRRWYEEQLASERAKFERELRIAQRTSPKGASWVTETPEQKRRRLNAEAASLQPRAKNGRFAATTTEAPRSSDRVGQSDDGGVMLTTIAMVGSASMASASSGGSDYSSSASDAGSGSDSSSF